MPAPLARGRPSVALRGCSPVACALGSGLPDYRSCRTFVMSARGATPRQLGRPSAPAAIVMATAPQRAASQATFDASRGLRGSDHTPRRLVQRSPFFLRRKRPHQLAGVEAAAPGTRGPADRLGARVADSGTSAWSASASDPGPQRVRRKSARRSTEAMIGQPCQTRKSQVRPNFR